MLQSVHEHPHLAGKQTVQQQQTGHLRLAVKDGSGGTELATDGQQHERLIEDQLQKQRHPERGQGHRADGEKADAVVQQLIFLFCRVDAQRNADNDGQNKGQQNQFHSGRHILRQLRCYRLFCIVVGTQVAMEQILQIVHMLEGTVGRVVPTRTGTGVAHCPISNMKLASGVARVPAHLVAGLEGSTRDTKNVSVTTPRRTRILLSNRFMIYFVILKLPPVGLASVQIDADRSLGI